MIALAEKIPGLAVRAKGKEDGFWEELSEERAAKGAFFPLNPLPFF